MSYMVPSLDNVNSRGVNPCLHSCMRGACGLPLGVIHMHHTPVSRLGLVTLTNYGHSHSLCTHHAAKHYRKHSLIRCRFQHVSIVLTSSEHK